MSSSETLRSTKPEAPTLHEREWRAPRDDAPHLLAGGAHQTQQASGPSSGGSLRSRIGDKDVTRSSGSAQTSAYRSEPSNKDDDRDTSRKRTVSGKSLSLHAVHGLSLIPSLDREKEASDTASGPGVEHAPQPPKKPRIINRNRYSTSQNNSYAIAKKLLPTDPQAGDKSRSGRKD